MDDKRFDELAKRVGTSRRSFLRKAVSIGGAAAVAATGLSLRDTEAARRGYGGPTNNQPSTETVSIGFTRTSSGCRPVFTVSGFDPNSEQDVYWYFYFPSGAGGPYRITVFTNASGTGSATAPLDLARGYTVTASVAASRAEAGPTAAAC